MDESEIERQEGRIAELERQLDEERQKNKESQTMYTNLANRIEALGEAFKAHQEEEETSEEKPTSDLE